MTRTEYKEYVSQVCKELGLLLTWETEEEEENSDFLSDEFGDPGLDVIQRGFIEREESPHMQKHRNEVVFNRCTKEEEVFTLTGTKGQDPSESELISRTDRFLQEYSIQCSVECMEEAFVSLHTSIMKAIKERFPNEDVMDLERAVHQAIKDFESKYCVEYD